MSLTEMRLAEEAKELVSQFNFTNRKPKKQEQLQQAKDLYKRIFYDKKFKRDKSRDLNLVFDNNIFAKITSCTKCAKTAYEALRMFSNWVLE